MYIIVNVSMIAGIDSGLRFDGFIGCRFTEQMGLDARRFRRTVGQQLIRFSSLLLNVFFLGSMRCYLVYVKRSRSNYGFCGGV